MSFSIRIGTFFSLILLLIACSEATPTATKTITPDHLIPARDKAIQLCAGCHGPAGIGTASFNPNLACQKKEYMIKQLNDYRRGARTNHQPMMNIAKMLSEEDVNTISEWYSITGCP